MKVSFVQLAPVLGDVGQTIRKIDRLLREAGRAELLVLPKLCNSGYSFQSRKQARETSERIEDSVFVVSVQ